MLAPCAPLRRHGAQEEEGEEGPEEEEEEQEFSPEKGNVAFASAYDGWAFRLCQFAEMYAGEEERAAAAGWKRPLCQQLALSARQHSGACRALVQGGLPHCHVVARPAAAVP